MRDLATALGVKLGDLAQPLRAALTGRATSPGIFDVLEILGREESLARISDQAARRRLQICIPAPHRNVQYRRLVEGLPKCTKLYAACSACQ